MFELDAQGRRVYPQVQFRAPEGSVEIYLVRHGESLPADPSMPFPLVAGRGDPELSERGREQSAALCERLAGLDFDGVYVTPLRRTTETVRPLLERTGATPVVDERLIELEMGEWEGGRYRERVSEGDPIVARVFREQRWELIPGGESNESLFARTAASIADIAARHAGGRALVVAHGISISAILAQATGSAPFAFVGANNASISVIVATPERLILRRFNDVAHLAQH